MNGINHNGSITARMRELYARVVYRNWPVWLGGVMIGLLSVLTFAWSRPIGVVGGMREWFDWSFYLAGVYDRHPALTPFMSSSSVITFGLVWGALSSALLSKQFAFRVPPPFEMFKGATGGILMGLGAAMSAGCNIGGFFSSVSALSLGGLFMMAGLIAGVFLETRYAYWEMQALRFRRGDGAPRRPRAGEFDWKRVQPLMGAAAGIAALVGVSAYFMKGVDRASGYDYAKTGGLLLSGVVLGTVFHRSRFAFVQAFRGPFATGDSAHSRAMAVAVMISVLGFAAIKACGYRPEWVYVAPTCWAGGFVGGLIFGFGMSFAGGCASGACWRSAEGGLKQAVAFLFMGATNSLFQAFLDTSPRLASAMGIKVFLPAHMSYPLAAALVLAVMLAWYLVTAWNEKTRAFV